MQILLNITEDGNVELTKGEYELVQGACCVTEFKINYPQAIKGVGIDSYKKQIEFGECKELGECVKFVDSVKGDIYELKEPCTQFKKIMVQFVLEYGAIKWKTVPFVLEFHESINAKGNAVIQTQLLSLAEIKSEWEAYIKANTLRMIYAAGDVPTANAASWGDTIFYLGANTDTAPLLTYGHYYRCNFVNGAYEWTDLTADPSLAGVADGIREINKNQTLQFWKGTTEELANEVPQENVGYIPEDEDIHDVFAEVLADMTVPKAGKANIVDFGAPIYLTSATGHFYDVPDFEEGAIYAVCFVINTKYTNASGVLQVYSSSASGLFVATAEATQSVAIVGTKFQDGYTFEYNKSTKHIYVDSSVGIPSGVEQYGEITDKYPNKLYFYKIGSVSRKKEIIIGGGLSASVDYVYYEAIVPAGRMPLQVGDMLDYMGEKARVTEYDEDGNVWTVEVVRNGKIAATQGTTITVVVE